MWVRGLKLNIVFKFVNRLLVAPRVGAWIETLFSTFLAFSNVVAPRVGAWIETRQQTETEKGRTSRTPCGCVD